MKNKEKKSFLEGIFFDLDYCQSFEKRVEIVAMIATSVDGFKIGAKTINNKGATIIELINKLNKKILMPFNFLNLFTEDEPQNVIFYHHNTDDEVKFTRDKAGNNLLVGVIDNTDTDRNLLIQHVRQYKEGGFDFILLPSNFLDHLNKSGEFDDIPKVIYNLFLSENERHGHRLTPNEAIGRGVNAFILGREVRGADKDSIYFKIHIMKEDMESAP